MRRADLPRRTVQSTLKRLERDRKQALGPAVEDRLGYRDDLEEAGERRSGFHLSSRRLQLLICRPQAADRDPETLRKLRTLPFNRAI